MKNGVLLVLAVAGAFVWWKRRQAQPAAVAAGEPAGSSPASAGTAASLAAALTHYPRSLPVEYVTTGPDGSQVRVQTTAGALEDGITNYLAGDVNALPLPDGGGALPPGKVGLQFQV